MELRYRSSGPGETPATSSSENAASGNLPADYEDKLRKVRAKSGFAYAVKEFQKNLKDVLHPSADIMYSNVKVMWVCVASFALCIALAVLFFGPLDASTIANGYFLPAGKKGCFNCSVPMQDLRSKAIEARIIVLSGCGRGAAREGVRGGWGGTAKMHRYEVKFVVPVLSTDNACLSALRMEQIGARDIIELQIDPERGSISAVPGGDTRVTIAKPTSGWQNPSNGLLRTDVSQSRAVLLAALTQSYDATDRVQPQFFIVTADDIIAEMRALTRRLPWYRAAGSDPVYVARFVDESAVVSSLSRVSDIPPTFVKFADASGEDVALYVARPANKRQVKNVSPFAIVSTELIAHLVANAAVLENSGDLWSSFDRWLNGVKLQRISDPGFLVARTDLEKARAVNFAPVSVPASWTPRDADVEARAKHVAKSLLAFRAEHEFSVTADQSALNAFIEIRTMQGKLSRSGCIVGHCCPEDPPAATHNLKQSSNKP